MTKIKGWHVCLAGIMAAVFMGVLAGCGPQTRWGQQPGRQEVLKQPESRLLVVTTLFPYYDFTRQIAGSHVELELVVPAGMDSHSFEPTPADMRLIQSADILIRNGGEMERWLDEVLAALEPSDMTVVTMMDYVDPVQEEMVEGMEEDGHVHVETDDGHVHVEADESHEDVGEYDEHIWTSPVNAMKLVEAISSVLSQRDGKNAAEYRIQTETYLAKLKTIDDGFREVSDARKRNTIVIGDKFPFRYLADEYSLDYRAAFSGCSSDTEPSAKTIAYLIDKVREEKIPAVYYLELSSSRVAEIIGEETGAKPLLLHSCHNVTRAQFDSGITYVELMEQNIENLRKGIDE